jgi:hypothetical protein
MTRGPRRLIDDPDFKWETGCDLADEALQVGGYDLPGAKEQLLARIASAPPVTVGDGVPAVRAASWPAAVKPVVGVVVAAALLAGAYWLGTRASTPEAAPAPEPVAVDPIVSAPAVEAAPLEVPPAVAEPEPEPVLEPVVEPEPEPVAEIEPEPEAVAEIEPEPVPETQAVADAEPEAPRSSIAAQMALYEPAADALQAGRYAAAIDGFRAYLDAWPDGDLRHEAELGLLQALFGAGDAEGTAALAETLQDRRGLASRREDILRLRAESLLFLVAEQLSTKAAAPIKRGCRLLRRDGP